MINRSCRLQKFGVGGVVVLTWLFACTIAKATSSVSLEWVPNTDPAVAGYNIYYGGMSRGYTNAITAGNSTNAVIQGLVEGKVYYFAVTAYDVFGDESDYSGETVFIVPGLLTLTPGTSPDDPLHIQFPVAPSHWYELQVSGDLKNWSTVWQVTGVLNTWVQFDALINNSIPQFFRVVLH